MVAFAKKLAQERPDEVALRDPDRAFSWAELDTLLNRVANGLIASDLGPDQRIAVFAENAAETALAHMGGLIGGASSVPVNFHLTAEEVAYILEDSGARILFVGPETAAIGVEAARQAGVDTVIGWRSDDVDGVLSWDAWLEAASADDPPGDHAPLPNLLYTSGTTGRPKGTNLPPTMFAKGKTVDEHLENVGKNSLVSAGIHGVIGPLYHTGPLAGSRGLVGGTPVVILGRFDPEETLRAIETYKIAASVMVPTHFVRLLSLPEETRAKYDVSSLVSIAHTGAACPVDVKRAMIDWWGPVLFEAYGASEVGTTCAITSHDWLKHPGSVGRPIPPFKVLVVDDDGNELAAGEEGRLYFEDTTGRGVVYHNDAAKSAEAHLRPGVFTLGEIGYVDEDGFVFITDRFSDMVLSGGVNIYPAESEKELINHPGIADVAVIGVPHAEMGEQLKALVIPVDPAAPPEPAEIISWVRERIATYKCPRSVEFVTDLGRNTMGKINKRKLRAPYWD